MLFYGERVYLLVTIFITYLNHYLAKAVDSIIVVAKAIVDVVITFTSRIFVCSLEGFDRCSFIIFLNYIINKYSYYYFIYRLSYIYSNRLNL